MHLFTEAQRVVREFDFIQSNLPHGRWQHSGTGNGGCRRYARLHSPALQDGESPLELHATNQGDRFG
jgi:hypothetical protein